MPILGVIASSRVGIVPLADTYTSRAGFPGTAGTNAGGWGVNSSNVFYYVGGESNANAYSYNFSTNSWSSALSWIGNNYYIWGTGDNGVGTKIWLPQVGAGGGNSNTLYGYETSNNTYTTFTSSPVSSRRGKSASDKTAYVYLEVGFTSAESNLFYRYDISGNSWTQMTNIPNVAYDSTFGYFDTPAVGKKIILDQGTFNPNSYSYDVVSNTWSSITSNPIGNEPSGAQQFGSLFYVGGNTGGVMAYYNPLANTWSAGATFSSVQTTGVPLATDGTYIYIFNTVANTSARYG
jgi:hypothetical protein